MRIAAAVILGGLAVGIGASLVMDLWNLFLKRAFGVPSLDYCLLGRWLRHLPRGTWRHENIARAAQQSHECAVGWIAHYTIGAAFALGFVVMASRDWLARPTLLPALLYGIGTVVFPFFVLQPSLGLGVASSRAPQPALARLKSLATHTVFGVGLYGCAVGLVACGTRHHAPPPAGAGAAASDSSRATPGPWCELADTGVEAAVAAVASQRDGDEYCEERHYAVDDIDADSSDDLALTFNLEDASGSNDAESYLMAFLSGREGRAPLLLRIDNVGDDDGARYPTDLSIDGQYVVVDFSVYLPGDPDCCPSGTSTVRFLVTGERIVEQAAPRHPPRSGARSL